ncbi:hypothetical protein [Thiomonas sp. FB-Cd]|uniref:hypothetical protein n=1 Tax=Thiomonas sp. FB-Cd TaxID=1158292 RepID=UPI00068F6AAD|nr:hypothetical protein [Thiomonas sp. FB-Cd]
MAAERDGAQARQQELHEQLPVLQQIRQEQQAAAQETASALASTIARVHALKALQDKVMTQGRIQPWLARHGLEGMARLWTRIHIEPGWETALEAALRERLAALEVHSLDAMAGFAADRRRRNSLFLQHRRRLAPCRTPMGCSHWRVC